MIHKHVSFKRGFIFIEYPIYLPNKHLEVIEKKKQYIHLIPNVVILMRFE